jgi:hypothetical protein
MFVYVVTQDFSEIPQVCVKDVDLVAKNVKMQTVVMNVKKETLPSEKVNAKLNLSM